VRSRSPTLSSSLATTLAGAIWESTAEARVADRIRLTSTAWPLKVYPSSPSMAKGELLVVFHDFAERHHVANEMVLVGSCLRSSGVFSKEGTSCAPRARRR